MDFIRVAYKEDKTGIRQFYPALQAIESQDLVVRGGQFAAIWDETKGLYSRKLAHMPQIIDRAFVKMCEGKLRPGDSIKKVREFDNQIFSRLMGMIRNIGDMGPELDMKLVFADQTPTKEDAATFKMGYSLSDADPLAWNELCSVLYGPEERLKFEYAIGSILAGHSLYLQKMYVFFGDPGTGKSTIMDIIELLFHGHTSAFSAADLGQSDKQFSLEPFKLNPLVSIDQDADLSRVEINNLINQIVSHDKMNINAKGKSLYEIIPRACLFVGTNKPVKITDSKSGLYRRVVDIHPTGTTFDEPEYRRLTAAVKFELGAIATHCLNVFNQLGPAYLSSYRPTDMMYRTNDIFNFVQDNRLILERGITLTHAFDMFKSWCEETDTRNVYKKFQFRDMLKDYFKEFHDQVMINGERHRSWYMDLRPLEKFSWKGLTPKGPRSWLDMEAESSLFDELMADMPAQLSTGRTDYPLKQSWDKTTTKLSDIDTTEEHFVKVPEHHIVIDFDEKDEHGNKSLAACLAKAALWPPTYAEPSRSGAGLHLHYDYEGDPAQLADLNPDGSEIKRLLGGASLRRRYSVSNGLPVSRISSGLPFKEEKPEVIGAATMASEKGLRKQIIKGLKKEVWPHTKPSMDFISKVLNDAVDQGLVFDISDMWDDILQFAMSSNNQKQQCLTIALALPLKSELDIESAPVERPDDKPLAVWDLEVYPNLFAMGYKVVGKGREVVKMINPSPQDVQKVIENYRLVGFYNRLYDNHIVWGRVLGYNNAELYKLSQDIIVENNRHRLFGAAYNLAYMDLYDVAVKKQSLKKWMIDLGLPHMEMDIPWDQPVPEDRVMDVMDYMANDILSTEAVMEHLKADIRAREMLAELSGLEVCNTNKQHTEKLIFGDDKEPQLEYTDLKETFPGYEFDRYAPGKEKSTYKGVQVGEGGYVYAEPGMYENVALLDVASMHPTSIINMNMFGKYTEKFKSLMDQRLEAKAKIKTATTDKERADALALSDALKLVINSVYGLTAASFPNKFRDPRNIDNIVAKRGALFMVDLKEFVEKAGFKVVHIKTDSIKIPNATPEIIAAVSEFGAKYGYSFEHEATYEKFVLLNDAVYVCREDGKWSATGKQYQHPVVFKTLFTQEEILPKDYVEIKQVSKGHMYLVNEETDSKVFVGKFGAFVPVLAGWQLIRIDGDKQGAVTGTKGYLWELDTLALKNNMTVDTKYFQALVDDAIANINKHGDYLEFIK
jgi:hypothetical protein